jgi:hypothetical protein
VGPTCHHLPPATPELGRATVASHHLRPPLNTSRCRPSAITPPHQSPPLNPSLCRLVFNGVKAITTGHFSASPPPGPYKRARSTPAHHHTHPRPPLLTPESATPTSPSTNRRRHFPPSPGHLAAARPPVRPLTGSPTPTPHPLPFPGDLEPRSGWRLSSGELSSTAMAAGPRWIRPARSTDSWTWSTSFSLAK